ncbi:UNVERIFIED_CONTAM: Heparan-alpha-glucosaminide N-acetyltransferase, partial [Sesamum latifolium]
NMSSRAAASKKAIFRALKLLILGVFLQGGYFHGINNLTYGVDMDLIRWTGILQRIAVAYLVAAMCEIWLRNDEKVSSGLSLLKKYKWHWIMMLMLTTIYMLLLYGLFVPDWEYQIPFGAPPEAKTFMVKCGVHGDTGPACNAAGMIDRMILGVQHLYRRPIYARTKQCSINSPDYGPLPPNAPSWCQAPFDPEGILSTVMAIVTCLIGLQFGHIIVHFKDHRNRLLLWLAPSSAFIVLGVLCDIFGMHINKALYSFSYTCVTSGLAGLLLATIYLVVDVYGCRRFALVLEWMGMNALLIYILVACNILPLILQGFYWRDPRNNIKFKKKAKLATTVVTVTAVPQRKFGRPRLMGDVAVAQEIRLGDDRTVLGDRSRGSPDSSLPRLR